MTGRRTGLSGRWRRSSPIRRRTFQPATGEIAAVAGERAWYRPLRGRNFDPLLADLATVRYVRSPGALLSRCSTSRAACRCISSSISMARAAIAARQWSIWSNTIGSHGLESPATNCRTSCRFSWSYLPARPRMRRAVCSSRDRSISSRCSRNGSSSETERYAAVFAAGASANRQRNGCCRRHGRDQGRARRSGGLDAAWEEAAVTFGPGNATDGCSVDRLRIQMRAANRDARHNVT